jgi:hypothetical protein
MYACLSSIVATTLHYHVTYKFCYSAASDSQMGFWEYVLRGPDPMGLLFCMFARYLDAANY